MLWTDIKFQIENVFLRLSKPGKIFTDIYEQRGWGNSPSVSGTGSDIEQTKIISNKIPQLLKKYSINTLIDAPCGDFYWLKNIKLPVKKYIGVDIVKSIISKNRKLYSDPKRKFIIADIINEPLPKGDLILCRDCLVHFSTADINKALDNFRLSGATYLLATTFPKHGKNPNIPTGRWRPIDLQSKPYNFPSPLELINEGCSELNGEFKDKSLGLWLLK